MIILQNREMKQQTKEGKKYDDLTCKISNHHTLELFQLLYVHSNIDNAKINSAYRDMAYVKEPWLANIEKRKTNDNLIMQI